MEPYLVQFLACKNFGTRYKSVEIIYRRKTIILGLVSGVGCVDFVASVARCGQVWPGVARCGAAMTTRRLLSPLGEPKDLATSDYVRWGGREVRSWRGDSQLSCSLR